MYQGKHNNSSGRAPRRSRSRTAVVALALVLVLGLAIGGTIAYLFTNTESITNTFTPASVPNTPEEKFDGTTKTEIKVKVEGNIAAYVRVKLVTYRVAEDGVTHIGGTAKIPSFTMGTDWFEKDGYYYYAKPVEAGETSGNLLDTSITLKEYDDADGGKQVIEVISESIQSVPTSVVTECWSVDVNEDGTLKADTNGISSGSAAGGITGY